MLESTLRNTNFKDLLRYFIFIPSELYKNHSRNLQFFPFNKKTLRIDKLNYKLRNIMKMVV